VALNVTLPGNTAAAISVPIAGMASPVITACEEGQPSTVVWRDGAFVPAVVAGLWAARLDGAYVTFQATSEGTSRINFAARASVVDANGMMPIACSGAELVCPPGAHIAVVRRAGVVVGGHARDNVWHRRYLITHLVEAACVGHNVCRVPDVGAIAAAVAPAVVFGDDEVAMDVCVEAMCA